MSNFLIVFEDPDTLIYPKLLNTLREPLKDSGESLWMSLATMVHLWANTSQ